MHFLRVLSTSAVQSPISGSQESLKTLFLRVLNLSRFRIWCLEFSSFGFVSNFGSFDIAQDTFRASSLFVLFLGVPVDVAPGMLCARCFPLTLARGEREWVRVDNLQITLVDCFLNEVNGRSWPSAKEVLRRHDSPMRFTARFYWSRVCPNWSVV